MSTLVSIVKDLVDVENPVDYPTLDWFNHVLLHDVTPSSSTGLPWKKRGMDKGSSFVEFGEIKENAIHLYDAVVSRVLALSEGVESDPISCFIKPEPHKPSKVKDGAWRIISGVGITDCFVDRMLFGNFLNGSIEKARTLDNPLLPGFVPYFGGYRALASKFIRPETADKSSWDWTVQGWMVTFLRRFFEAVTDNKWHGILNNRLTALFQDAELDFEGYRFRQNCDGIMKSGCLGTIIFNSLLQLAIHVLSCMRSGEDLKPFYAVGDDTIQETCSEEYWDEVKKCGAIVKERIGGWPAEFIGIYFNDAVGLPMYATKNFFRLLFAEAELLDDILAGYMRLYANSPLFTILNELAIRKGVTLSKDDCLTWFNG